MSIQSKVLEALMERKGKNTTTDQLSKSTGFNKGQVGSACFHLLKHETSGVTRVMNGVYRYDEDAQPKRAREATYIMLRVVATLPEGWSIGIEEDSGKAYRLEKM